MITVVSLLSLSFSYGLPRLAEESLSFRLERAAGTHSKVSV